MLSDTLFLSRAEYKIILQQPDLQLVDLGGQKSNLLPPELCQILPDQPYRGKLTEEHTAAMITTAARPPNINAQSIVHQGLDLLGFRQGNAPLGAFGVSVGSEMTVVPGRILPPPGIKYSGSAPRVDERASWNLRDVKFAKGARLADWAVLLIKDNNGRDEFSGRSDPELLTTIRGFANMCGKSGMSVDRKDPVIVEAAVPPKDAADPTRFAAIRVIEATLRTITKKPSIVLVILSNGDKHIYSGLKHLCDSRLDLGKSHPPIHPPLSHRTHSPSNRVRPFK
jgi:eukaryotic translation initiation factor 2C